MEIQFPDIFGGTGDQIRRRRKRADDFCARAAVQEAAADAEVVLLFHWPREHNEFIELKVKQIGADGHEMEFAQEPNYIKEVKKVCGLQIPPMNQEHVAKLRRTDELLIDLTVRTGHPAFARMIEKLSREQKPAGPARSGERPAPEGVRPEGLRAPLGSEAARELLLVLGIRVATAVKSVRKAGEIELAIKLGPLHEPPVCSGVVAVDFGNSSTTISSMDNDAETVDQIRLIDIRANAALPPAERPIPTVLRVTGCKDPPAPAPAAAGGAVSPRIVPSNDPLKQADLSVVTCLISEEATKNATHDQQRRILYGAKRLLSDMPGDAGFMLELDRRQLRCRRRLLAELYLTEALRGFIRSEKRRPDRVVITCPTTFTPRERQNLKEAFARAWWRVCGMKMPEPTLRSADNFVANVIDEASAAAFYFVYRDVISADGHVPAFRFTYPDGLHALLIDCGGGTTDIALVRATPESESSVSIRVLGRAGHRTFGGDYITKQLFRLLKAKLMLASGLSEYASELSEPSGDDWRDFLKRYDGELERCLPTRFDPAQVDDTAADRCREATYQLWTLAEAFKRTLSASELLADPDNANSRERVKVDNKFEVQFYHVLSHSRTLDMEFEVKFEKSFGLPQGMLNRIFVRRNELNRLIEDEARRTIAYANHLVERLRNSMANGATPPGIERVYLVGNASLYPYVRQMLVDPEHGLHVPFLTCDAPEAGGRQQNGQVLVDSIRPEDMKGAVVKGAVLAQRMRLKGMSVSVAWDHDLINKLPYSIIHKGYSYADGYKLLYAEGTRYEDCVGAFLEQPPDKSGKPTVSQIPLHILWPGDSDLESAPLFATFDFKNPVVGKLVCDFGEQERFWLSAQGGDRVPGRPPEEGDQLGPVQSGKL